MTAEQSQMIEALYLEMFDKMMAYARCSFDNESLAEEAVQETFRIACQKPEQLCQSVNPRGWLVQTLKYTICNIQSSRATAKKLVEKYWKKQSMDSTFSEDRVDLHILYEDVAHTEEFQLLIETAIEGRSHLEMANSRDISVEACKKRVQRAKETLRKKLNV